MPRASLPDIFPTWTYPSVTLDAVKLLAALALSLAALFSASVGTAATTSDAIARGKYLVGFACNDCHTPRWRESDGSVPVSDWLTGSAIGYRGPWGTSYAPNLRLEFQTINEEQWIFMTRTRGGRWPMVWQDVRMLSDDDRRSIYRFIRSLGPKGTQARASVPPWLEPATPYLIVVPLTPKPQATS